MNFASAKLQLLPNTTKSLTQYLEFDGAKISRTNGAKDESAGSGY
jgi:hypothetical protein